MSAPEDQGPKAPLGRPPADPETLKDDLIKIRCTKAEKAKFAEVGGAKWFRAALKRAKPAPKP